MIVFTNWLFLGRFTSLLNFIPAVFQLYSNQPVNQQISERGKTLSIVPARHNQVQDIYRPQCQSLLLLAWCNPCLSLVLDIDFLANVATAFVSSLTTVVCIGFLTKGKTENSLRGCETLARRQASRSSSVHLSVRPSGTTPRIYTRTPTPTHTASYDNVRCGEVRW